MRIAVLRGPETFAVEEVPLPSIRPDEVLVRVAVCGVCASELEPWLVGPPAGESRFLGHEVSGVVVEVGADVSSVQVGDRVGVWVTERGFAEYVAVRAAYCFPAGDGPLDVALAEPLACAVNAVEAADVRLGDDVVVLGAGFMGNLVQELAALRGPRRVIVADPRPEALARAAELGASAVVDVNLGPVGDAVRGLTDGRGADVTFECTGTQDALTTCGEVTRMSGRIAVVGYHQGAARTLPLGLWNWMAFDLVNAHVRDIDVISRGMAVGMRLHAAGMLSLDRLVTHRFALEDVDAAFAALRDKPEGFVKAVVTFPEA
ncbi:zinc-binding dehydrogenase [Nocardioides sp. zg-579]|uniref:Zinc-binding dehydrogenase n=1 Tax=Nocardioides marmotae TaxID=2663857 RepID=A0A6I3JC84_9ACTN|nr:zinc-binding dehydrogenase [Nocardioides marmotae]MCR6032126.1 zinc-binding dehydrogenase [Gordonia jinghuaiqii]MTB95772.1 zinc-binding dehydrogenase [Nocardioides marmotae]QKE02867.1 zinc-binding dehydrogenase [Nocardioides marmotae]